MSSEEGDYWVLGVTLGLLGSIAINTGNNIQSLGLKRLQENARIARKKDGARKRSLPFLLHDFAKTVPTGDNDRTLDSNDIDVKISPVSSVTWIIGTFVFVSGSLLNFASYAFAAQSMLASLESIQFVTNILFGKFLLGANVTKTMLLGTALTVMGTVLAVQFSSKETLELNTAALKQLYLNPAYVIYLVLVGGLLISLDSLYRIFEKFKNQGAPLKYSETMMPLIYSVWSALFGTQSVVQAKVLAELLAVHSSGEEDIFRSWFTYASILLWLLTVVVWLKRLNDALAKFNPLFIIPLLQCSFIFFAIVSGGIFFQEFNSFTSSQWLGFWCGVSVMFSGLALLTPKNKKGKDSDLPKEVINLLLSSGGATHGSHMSIVRPPSTPAPTPRHGIEGDHEEQEGWEQPTNQIMNDAVGTELVNEASKECHESPLSFFRAHRSTRELSRTAVEAMKDVAKETAQQAVKGTSLLLTPHQGTAALTDAMVAATAAREKKLRMKENLKRLRLLLTEAPDGGMSNEVMDIIREVKLDAGMSAINIDFPATPCDATEESDQSLSMDSMVSPRTLRQEILRHASELEEGLSSPRICANLENTLLNQAA